VTIALGIWDLLALGIPGALQLALFGYIAVRMQWLDLDSLLREPSGLLFMALAVLSFLLGHLFYVPGKLFDRLTSRSLQRRSESVKRHFLERNPAARDCVFLDLDVYLLHAAVELKAREVASEISRLLASALMMRNAAVPLSLATVTALVELYLRHFPTPAIVAAIGFATATYTSVKRSVRVRGWALSKAFELAFWIPEIEQQLRPLKRDLQPTLASRLEPDGARAPAKVSAP
jgi:hypothetical protein